MGVSSPSSWYSERLTYISIDELSKFVISDDNEKDLSIKLNYRDIKALVEDWGEYIKFPVSEILLNIKLLKQFSKKDAFKFSPERPYKVGGEAHLFGNELTHSSIESPIKMNVDHSIGAKLGLSIFIRPEFDVETYHKLIFEKIENVILHELLHMYEFYQRLLTKSSSIDLSMTSTVLGDNTMKRPKNIWEYWTNNFTDLIYISQPHELRAEIQGSKMDAEKLSFEDFKKKPTWETAKKMQEFKYDKFIVEFNKVVYEHNPDYVNDITDSLIKKFIKDYKKYAIEYGENPKIKPSSLEKMSTEEFFRFFEKEINRGGEYLIKRLTRLFSRITPIS
jgi:hypothetical protein